MREFVFIIALIGATHAGYDDYWDANNDGVLNDDSIIMKRKGNYTHFRSTQHNATQAFSRRWTDPADIGALNREPIETFDNMLNNYLEQLTHFEAMQCVVGIMRKDGCYECFCVGGQVYICSSQNCPFIDQLKKKKLINKDNYSKQLLASKYKEPNCVDGKDNIITSSCKKCTCINGEIYCDTMKCHQSRRQLPQYGACKPKESIPSPDNCNKCICFEEQIFCTTMVCGPIIKTEYRHCPPKKWHNLNANSHCNECYCIDGQLSFCYLDYCSTRVEILEGSKNIQAAAQQYQLSLPVATATCKAGEKKYDKCTRCECNALNKWRCWSEPEKPNSLCRGKVQSICAPGQYFTLGTADTCQACYCGKNRKYKCWSVKGACANFNDDLCPAGDIVKNKVSACSVCYCGIDGTNMCTTDVNCAHSAQVNSKSSIDNILCLSKCVKKHKKFGISLKDGCKCI